MKDGEWFAITNFTPGSTIACPELQVINETAGANDISFLVDIVTVMSAGMQKSTVWTSAYNLNQKKLLLGMEGLRGVPVEINFDDAGKYSGSVDMGELKMRYVKALGGR
ncbi:hypothetical protein DMA11_01280 [Marinilabiliaceae bacterium JC017]|nr:hypothetical protein DMA11_01280 [Marinilabiliaceae bacterium JC017]